MSVRGKQSKQRVLAIASKFKTSQLDYLRALAERVDLVIAVNGEEREGITEEARQKGLPVIAIGRFGLQKLRTRIGALVERHRPDTIHSLYHYNEEVTVLARGVADTLKNGARRPTIVHESRDPLTTLLPMTRFLPGSNPQELEKQALKASDGQVFVSKAMCRYFEQRHDLDLESTSLTVPMCFCSRSSVGPRQPKLSAYDGRVHIVLDGSVSARADHGRNCLAIIRRLVGLGLVVHSHFHDLDGDDNQAYRKLSARLDDYHFHETIPFDRGTEYSQALSRYDLLGVFHELEARHYNEAALVAINMPTKAVSAWLCGGIPTVSFSHYRGVAEVVRALGVGFVIERWEELRAIAGNADERTRASQACWEYRDRFTTDWAAERLVEFYQRLSSRIERT